MTLMKHCNIISLHKTLSTDADERQAIYIALDETAALKPGQVNLPKLRAMVKKRLLPVLERYVPHTYHFQSATSFRLYEFIENLSMMRSGMSPEVFMQWAWRGARSGGGTTPIGAP